MKLEYNQRNFLRLVPAALLGRYFATWRQQVGGSAIEASKIAGHSTLEMTGDYTFVPPERQNELTRRIQAKLAAAVKNNEQAAEQAPLAILPDGGVGPAGGWSIAEVPPLTGTVQ